MLKWKLFVVWLINFVSLIKNVEILALGSWFLSWIGMVVPTAVGSLGIRVLRVMNNLRWHHRLELCMVGLKRQGKQG
ncbi:hypothetical protein BT93_L2222 [Corymbia citriodora subsp. variegata]|uniref:Transmembrane protein n=1 Tax=Corymbia citriodora subsp. variegata TaxID=360336 RepID=A0A8T0CKM5_CORYI|nr:hypothetical protein BT93_L2222 [Corymbia citriodora subsp. variegata]